MTKSRIGPVLVVLTAATLLLTGCSGDPATSACLDAIEARLGDKFAGVEITEDIRTPGGAIDINGTYNGGNSFACALSEPPLELHQVLVFTFDGEIISVK